MFGKNQPVSQYVMLAKCTRAYSGLPINAAVPIRNTSNTTLSQDDYINNKKYIVTMLGNATSAVKPLLGNLYVQTASCNR
jgi:hypothetical protein